MGKYGWMAGVAVLSAGVALNLQPEYVQWIDEKICRSNPMEGILALQLYVSAPVLAAYAAKCGIGTLEDRINLK
jgi:hypothetical protein